MTSVYNSAIPAVSDDSPVENGLAIIEQEISQQNEPTPAARRNPLLWVTLIVIGLILFVFLGGDRDESLPSVQKERVQSDAVQVDAVVAVEPVDSIETVETVEPVEATESDEIIAVVTQESSSGAIERSLLVPPGMRAREYIKQLRDAGEPYPLSQVFDKAQKYRNEGSLADAHLLYFFAARESHLPSVMMMAEMTDPILFRAENSLLDQSDPVQAVKWYRMAAELGQPGIDERLDALRDWAADASGAGDPAAAQLLLSIQ